MCMWRACCVKEWWRVDWPRRADCLGAYRRSPVLLRRTIRGHLRRSRPEKSLNVSQRIRLRYFSGLRPCIWPRLLRLATKGFSDRLLGCARGGGRTGTPRRLPYGLGVSDTPAHSSDALFRSQSETAQLQALEVQLVQNLERLHLLVAEVDQVELAVLDEPGALKSAAGRADQEDGRSFFKPDHMDLGVRLDRNGERAELAQNGRGRVKKVEHRRKARPLHPRCQ